MVDALLVMDVESDDPRIDTLSQLGHPSVLIGLPEGRRAIPCVDFDFEAAGWLAVDRLVALGHRRVALIGSPPEVMSRHTSYADRLARGFLAACEANGVTGTVHACPSSAESVATVDAVMTENPDITGFFVHNEGALPHVATHHRATRSTRAATTSPWSRSAPTTSPARFRGSPTASPCPRRPSAQRRPT